MNVLVKSFLSISILLFLSFANYDFEDWKDKVDPLILENLSKGDQSDFIIQMKSQASIKIESGYKTKLEKSSQVYKQLTQIAKNSQKEAIDMLQKNNTPFKSYWIVNVIYTKGDIHLVEQIARLNSVAKITRNQRLVVQETTPVNTFSRGGGGVEWGIDNIGADRVWALGYHGEGVVVAGQDTGVEWFHPAIKNKYRGLIDSLNVDHNYNWHDAIHTIIGGGTADANPCGVDIDHPCDDYNHGTHTIGTMVGGEDDLGTKIGVAPKSKWIACRNMERGNGTPVTYIECFQWLMAPTDINNENPRIDKSPDVINNSWGCPNSEGCDTTNYAIMEKVVDNVKAAGIVVVVSAGNSGNGGCGTVSAPAAIYENSFTVGATADIDVIANFSSKGPVIIDGSNRMKPNISAPGVNVRSCIRNGLYANWNGTSMAGPHVAGVVALMISANPSLSGQVETIENIIESTARKHTYDNELCGQDTLNAIPNNAYGYGIIDAFAAVKKALAFVTDSKNMDNQFEINITPNPIHDFANLKIAHSTGDIEWSLFNVNGQMVMHKNMASNSSDFNQELDLRNLSAGVYFYQLNIGENIFHGKLVRE